MRRVLLAASVLALGLAHAQDPSTLDAAGLDPELELARARAEERTVLDQLATFDIQLNQLGAEAAMLQGRIDELDDARRVHADQVDEADRRLATLNGEVRLQVRLVYRLRRQGVAPVLFGAESPTDLRRLARYLVALLKSDLSKVRAFRSTLAEKQAAMASVEGDLGKLNQLKAEYADKEEELREQRAGRVEFLDRIHSRRDLAMRVVAERQAIRRDFDSQLAGWAPTEGSTPGPSNWGTGSAPTDWMGTSAPRPAASGAIHFRDAFGALPWPVTGRVVRRFGDFTNPATGQREHSQGLAIAANLGDPVRSVFRGQVIMAGYVNGLGQIVVVRHGDYTTVYAHLNEVSVRNKQAVEQGQVLGFVGNTGLTDGEGFRLGFELRYNNTTQNPLPWLVRQ